LDTLPPTRQKTGWQALNPEPLPREIFTPLNLKIVQLGHDSDSEVYPVKFIYLSI